MNEQFSMLVTGQSTTTLGNFASLTTTDPKIDFAGSLINKKGSVWNLNASGKATDGLLAIFENSKLNTQVAIELKYHSLALNNLSLSYNEDSAVHHNQKVNKIKFDFDIERKKILYRRDSMDLLEEQKSVNDGLTKLRDSLNKEVNPSIQEELKFLITKKEILEDSVTNAIKDVPKLLTDLRNLHAKTIAQLEKLSFSTAVESFTLSWFSFGYKVNHNKFKLFYAANQFDQQIIDTTFVTHEGSIQWSYYNWNAEGFKTKFIAFGAKFGYADNFTKLDKREISETTNYGPVTGARSSTTKFDTYKGTYSRNLVTLKFYNDSYFFLFNKNIAALHFNPEWDIQKREKPIANVMTGILLVFKKKDQETSVLNAELYYQFTDIFKNTETHYKLFERNAIGLRFTFPIQFKYK